MKKADDKKKKQDAVLDELFDYKLEQEGKGGKGKGRKGGGLGGNLDELEESSSSSSSGSESSSSSEGEEGDNELGIENNELNEQKHIR
jgi:hypothetical protein